MERRIAILGDAAAGLHHVSLEGIVHKVAAAAALLLLRFESIQTLVRGAGSGGAQRAAHGRRRWRRVGLWFADALSLSGRGALSTDDHACAHAGLSRFTTGDDGAVVDAGVSALKWAAPEAGALLRHSGDRSRRAITVLTKTYSSASDVWSFGVLVVECMTCQAVRALSLARSLGVAALTLPRSRCRICRRPSS